MADQGRCRPASREAGGPGSDRVEWAVLTRAIRKGLLFALPAVPE